MVETQELRDAFVARLNKALDEKDGVRKGRGRNVDFFAGLRTQPAFSASTQATHKWLKAESMPGRANMLAIAEWLGVRVEWLQYGEGEMRQSPQQSDNISAPATEQAPTIGSAPRKYQNDLYEAAPADQRKAVDEIAEKMLALTPEQALKLKQAMDLLMPSNEPRKD